MTDMIEKVAKAIEDAQYFGREGPYGGYDYGHNNPNPPEKGRYVIKDYRGKKWGEINSVVHQTDSQELHDSVFEQLTKEHLARAAITAMLEPTDEMLNSACGFDTPLFREPSTGVPVEIDDITKEKIRNDFKPKFLAAIQQALKE